MSSLIKKFKYAAETAKDVAVGVLKGEDTFVSKEEKDARMETCKGCEHYQVVCNMPRCNECGCFALLKTELKAAKCPLKKWQ